MAIGTMPFVVGDHGWLSIPVIGASIRMDLRVPIDHIRVDSVPHKDPDRPSPIAFLRLWSITSGSIAVAVPAISHQATQFSVCNRMALTVFEMEIEHHFLLRISRITSAAAYRAMPAATTAPTLRLLMPLKRNLLIGIREGRPDRQRLSPCALAKGETDLPVKTGPGNPYTAPVPPSTSLNRLCPFISHAPDLYDQPGKQRTPG